MIKFNLDDFPEHNWKIIKNNSNNESASVRWAKISCADCGLILDCFYISDSSENRIYDNKINVYERKFNKSHFKYEIKYGDNVKLIKEKIYNCSETIIKKII